ncbi:MAG: helix-turn-helix transcriptional regulator [Paracoccaceae bacterium]
MSEDAFREALAQRLRDLMKRRGWSLDEFAQECRIPKRSIEKYVRGVTVPGAQALHSICMGADADSNWLLLGADDPAAETHINAVHDAAFNSFRQFIETMRRRLYRPDHAEMLKGHLEVDGLREASRWAMKTADQFRQLKSAKRAEGHSDMGETPVSGVEGDR